MALAAALSTGGCFLGRSGALSQNCTADGECDDGNPCTEGACNADGFCFYTALPDGDRPEDAQTTHDCRTERCEGGQPVTDETPADHPPPGVCLAYECVDMEVEEAILVDGEDCEENGVDGHCDQNGDCHVGCTTNADCDDDIPCTDDQCDIATGACDHVPLNNILAPDSDQVDGDCHQILCQDGAETDIIDDTDLPLDDNDCTEDLCNEGVPSNPNRPANFTCSVPNGQYEKVCDGAGTCVECNGPSQCDHLPEDTFCGTRTCTLGVCGQDCTANNTATPAQQPNDCKTQVCDGACGMTQIANPGDLPDDNNDCTQDICTGMTPSNPPEALNEPCGSQGTLYCNGSGSCVGCTSNSQCPVDVFCRDHFCNSQQQCDWNDTPNNTPLPQGSQTDGDCQELQCNGTGGVKSVNDWDPFVDGNQCTRDLCSSGNPVNPPRAIDYACSQNGGSYCDGAGNCVECNSATQCSLGDGVCEDDDCSSNNCIIVPHSSSTPAPGGYQTTGDCKTRVCNGSGGVNGDVAEPTDLPDDNNECTINQCNGSTPAFPPVSNGTLCDPDGQFCTGVEWCQSGNCVSPGDPCDGPDGDSDCSETCREQQNDCNGADPNGVACNDGIACNGSDTCSGGSCSTHTGDPCAGNYSDGNCSGGCNEGNGGTCDADEPENSPCDDGLYCTGVDTCDATGGCNKHTGDPCDGVDTDTDCSEQCQESGGGNCDGNDPPGSSCDSGAGTCDGAGTCEYPPTCGTSPTASGSCPDDPPCDGGCSSTTCTIDCTGVNACEQTTITCPSDKACVIDCNGNNACKQTTINCPAGYACTVNCSNTNSCEDAVVNCGATDGVCTMNCSADSNSCNQAHLWCGANDCTATCQTGGGQPTVHTNTNSSCTATSC